MRFVCKSLTQPLGQQKFGQYPIIRLASIAFLGGLAVFVVSAQNGSSDAGKRWFAHVQYLADDSLEGRLTGSEGYRKAALYVADHFKQ